MASNVQFMMQFEYLFFSNLLLTSKSSEVCGVETFRNLFFTFTFSVEKFESYSVEY